MLAITYPNNNISKYRAQQNSSNRKKGNAKSKYNKQCSLIKIDVLGIASVRERMLGNYWFVGW